MAPHAHINSDSNPAPDPGFKGFQELRETPETLFQEKFIDPEDMSRLCTIILLTFATMPTI